MRRPRLREVRRYRCATNRGAAEIHEGGSRRPGEVERVDTDAAVVPVVSVERGGNKAVVSRTTIGHVVALAARDAINVGGAIQIVTLVCAVDRVDDMQGPHHIVVFMRKDVAVPDVVPGQVERLYDLQHLARADPYRILVACLFGSQWEGTADIVDQAVVD